MHSDILAAHSSSEILEHIAFLGFFDHGSVFPDSSALCRRRNFLLSCVLTDSGLGGGLGGSLPPVMTRSNSDGLRMDCNSAMPAPLTGSPETLPSRPVSSRSTLPLITCSVDNQN